MSDLGYWREHNRDIHKGDIIEIGEPPNTDNYLVITEPDEGRYCRVLHTSTGRAHTVYLGRWALLPAERVKANAAV